MQSDSSTVFIYTPGDSSPVYVSTPHPTVFPTADVFAGLSSPLSKGFIQTASSFFAACEYSLFSMGANYRNSSEKWSKDESPLALMALLFFDKASISTFKSMHKRLLYSPPR